MRAAGYGAGCVALLIAALWLMRPALPETSPRILANSAGIETVLVFGTSLSAPPYRWPDDLGREMAHCLDNPIKLIRVTQPGASSDWAKTQLAAVLEHEPDLVIVEFAVNDADLSDGLSLQDSRTNHQDILATLRRELPQTRIILMTTGPVQGLQKIKRYRLGRYFRVYSDFSTQFGTGLIHMHPHWTGRKNPDGLHPQNGDASAVMVPQLLATIDPKRCASNG